MKDKGARKGTYKKCFPINLFGGEINNNGIEVENYTTFT